MIFNIQKCSIHDGIGLRTIVFFKGCPLHCAWCANPESQSYQMQIMEFPKKCIGCGECVKACKTGAIHPQEDGLRIDRSADDKSCHLQPVLRVRQELLQLAPQARPVDPAALRPLLRFSLPDAG